MSQYLNKIAVIGLAGRFPGANNINELLDLLIEGKDQVNRISEERIVRTTLPFNDDYLIAGYLSDIDEFDYQFFSYTPIEAKSMDPHIRIAIENTYHCFEDAGYSPAFFKGTNTMVVASNSNLNYYRHADEFNPTLITGNETSFLATAISRKFGLQGSSLVVDTSCSSGLAAVQSACDALLLHRCDYSVVVSGNINLFPEQTAFGLDLDSKTGKSKSFSAEADGMSYGEVCVALLLKPLDKAVADNDNIHAVIRAITGNNNADLSASPTSPNSVSITNLLIETWEKAGIDPENIKYIEAHGSGTALGDSIEVLGINTAFKKYTKKKHFCSLSTIKTNIGHTRNSSGIAGLVKVILSVREGLFFPHLHFKEPNPLIDFEDSAVIVQKEIGSWAKSKGSQRLAGVTTMGLSGINFHAVIEEAPEVAKKDASNKDPFIITVSAPSIASLDKKFNQLKDVSFDNYDIADITYTMLVGKEHFKYRRAGLVSNTIDIKNFTEMPYDEANIVGPDKLRTVFLAIQSQGVNETYIDLLCDRYTFFYDAYHTCLEIARDRTNAFVIEFAFQYSFFRLLEEIGMIPDIIIAIGPGEWIVKIANGKATLKDAIDWISNATYPKLQDVAKRTSALLEREREKGFPVFIDLGLKSAVTEELLLKYHDRKDFVLAVSGSQNNPLLNIVLNWYQLGGNFNWQSLGHFLSGKRISLPTYPFDKTRCWLRESPKNADVKLTKSGSETLTGTTSELELTMISIWEEQLADKIYSVDDDFFDLGGNSLKASKIIIKCKKLFNVDMGFEDIFDFPTIRLFTENIKKTLSVKHQLERLWKNVLKVEKVNEDDNFFDIGGHSLLVNSLINAIAKEFKLKLNFEDVFNKPTFGELTKLIEGRHSNSESRTNWSIPVVPVQKYYPMSLTQRRLWILCQFDEASSAYNESLILKIDGVLDVGLLASSLRSLIERHEILRTVFKENDSGDVFQYVINNIHTDFKLDYLDFRDEHQQDELIKATIHTEVSRIFNLSEGPLLRLALIQLDDRKFIFVLVIHHIISDAWSMGIMLNELFVLYQSYSERQKSPLIPLRIQYKDYTAWLQNQLTGENLEKQKRYWLECFRGELPVLGSLSSSIRPTVKTYNGQILYRKFDQKICGDLNEICRANGCTLFMVLFSCVTTLLYKYTNQEEIIIGTPIAGRPHTELENQVGFYVNTLPLRIQFAGSESYNSLLQLVKNVTLGAYEHQLYPFDELVNELKLKRDMSHNALFDIMIVLQNLDTVPEIDKGPFNIDSYIETEHQISRFDLTFRFSELEGGMFASLEYNCDIYTDFFANQLFDHFGEVLKQITAFPENSLNELDYLSENEKQLILQLNDSLISPSTTVTVIDLFEQQVLKSAESIALIFEDKKLTYLELNEYSNQFAYYLIYNCAIRADDLIGIMLNHSEWMIIALLGILKSGAAYVPIDPGYPSARIKYILNDSNCKALIDEATLKAFKAEHQNFPKENPPSFSKTDNLAYVIYTSGSTANPKGVMIEHHSLVNYLDWASNAYFEEGRSLDFGLFTSLSFDLTITSIYLPLVNGRLLNIYNSHADILEMLESYTDEKSGLGILKLTPSHISLINDITGRKSGIKKVIVGGEMLYPFHIRILEKLNPGIEIYNEYGPTEATVGCAFWKIEDGVNPIPIGRPIANATLYIINNQQLCPMGVKGEICIGGAGLARGYLNRPDLTAEKFIENPFMPGRKMYRTGDLGRWMADGNIEFVGRLDDQVKIRGYRIELGEIEDILRRNKDINNAVVIARSSSENEMVLFAYITSKKPLNIAEVRSYLIELLPGYMIPGHYVQLKSFPLTPNGKVDKSALTGLLDQSMETGTVYIAPRSETEECLTKIWREILNKEHIGMRDNFFDLGGDSFKIIKLSKQMSISMGRKISIALLFQYSNIEGLSAYLNNESEDVEETFDREELIDNLNKFNIEDYEQ